MIKNRWIRFEEQAENIIGRWSKPHVATVAQTAIDDLKDLITDGIMMLDVLLTDTREIAGICFEIPLSTTRVKNYFDT